MKKLESCEDNNWNREQYPEAPEAEEEGDLLSNGLLSISKSSNHYAGLRSNVALDILAGPSPADLLPGIVREQDGEQTAGLLSELYFSDILGGDPDSEQALLMKIEQAVPSPVEREMELKFLNKRPLPAGSVTNSALINAKIPHGHLKLLADGALPAFLRKDSRIQTLFREAWRACLLEVDSSAADPPEGIAATIDTINRNEFRLVITARGMSDGYQAKAAFYINEENFGEE